jgi:hypothetical protein
MRHLDLMDDASIPEVVDDDLAALELQKKNCFVLSQRTQ